MVNVAIYVLTEKENFTAISAANYYQNTIVMPQENIITNEYFYLGGGGGVTYDTTMRAPMILGHLKVAIMD
jgi:hypothetical protein